ncbi:MAG: diguanylate cyclase [Anaerolineales bacterium]
MENIYYVLPLYLSATLMMSLAMYAWWYREEPVALPFALALVIGAIWPLTYGLELSSIPLDDKVTWIRIRHLFLPYLPLAWLILVYTYVQDRAIHDWKRILTLAVIPTTTAVLALTSSRHDLFRFNFQIARLGQLEIVTYQNGPWHWVHLIYTYALFVIILGMLVHRLWQTNDFQRKQALLVSASILLPLVTDILIQFRILDLGGYNPASGMLAISAVLMGIALFRFKLLSVVPVARNALIENMPDAMLVLDEQWRIIDSNPAALRLLGPDAGTPGEPLKYVLRDWAESTNLNTIPDNYATELRLGALNPAHFSLRLQAIRNRQGQLTSRLLVLHDISAYRQAEQALRDSQLLYHTLVEAMPIGIFRKNLNGQYNFVNQIYCEKLSKTPDEILGKTDIELYPENIARKHIETDRLVLESGQPYASIDHNNSDDNHPQHIEFIKTPVRNAEGKVIGVQGIFWDVTERINAELESRQRLNELTTINTITQAITSEIDCQSLLELIAKNVMALLRVDSLYIALLDPQKNLIEIPYMLDAGERVYGETLQIGEGLTSHILKTGQPLIINQNYQETRQALGVETHMSARLGIYPKAWMGVPILANGETIGVIGASDYNSEHAFQETDVRLLSTVAANIGVAIQKARLYELARSELRERQRAEEALARRLYEISLVSQITQVASTHLNLADLIEFAGRKIEEVFLARSVFIALHDKIANEMEVPYWTIGQTRVTASRFPMGVGLTGLVFTSQKPLLISENFETRSRELGAVLQHADKFGYPKTWLGVPMIVGSETIGVISVQDYERENAYSEFEINLLSTIASNIAISFENARLYEKIRQDNIALQGKIEEIASLQAELREQAIRDPLTNLFNRRYLEETLTRELSRAEREEIPLSLIILDLDYFKKFNDHYGHMAGDALLRRLANLLLRSTRESDIACRYGGEEFIVVMPGSPLEAAYRRAEEIRQEFEKTNIHVDGITLNATVSMGVAAYPQNALSEDALIRAADQALYAAKSSGRNQVLFSTAIAPPKHNPRL